MKRIRKYISIMLSGVIALTLGGCNMIEKTPEAISKTVLAKVGDVKITRGQVDKSLAYILQYYEAQYGENFEENEEVKESLKTQRESAVNSLVEQEVLLANKKKIGVKYTDEEINKEVEEQLASIKEEYKDDEKGYNKYLKSYGYNDENDFKEDIKKSVIIKKITDKIVEDIEVTDKEVEEYYNDNISTYKVAPGGDVTHILFSDKTTGEADAKAARELVLQGKTFDEIAAMDQYKDKSKAEDLGYQVFENNTTLVEEFVEGFKNLPEGEVSQPVKTSYGWHLIKINNIQKEERTKTLEEVKEDTKETLLNQKKNEKYTSEIEKLKEKMKIKIYSDRY